MESSEPFTLVSMSSSNTITLRSSDDEHFVVDPDVAMLSTTVWAIVEDAGTEDAVPLPNVSGTILAKVVEYCKHVVATDKAKGGEPPKGKSAEEHASAVQEASDAWDADFVKVDQGTLFELILAANYMNIKILLDLTCLTVANMIKGKSPEEIRKTFNIQNDFTPEEEAEVKKENAWAFE